MAEEQAGESVEEPEVAQSERDSMIAVRCEACGGLFRARQWRDGITCPKCRGAAVKPVVPPGGAVDYDVADRSQGYTPADIRFAQWAKWTQLITPSQYEKALLKQNRLVQDGKPMKPIHEVMIDEGFLEEGQAVGLLEFMARPRPDEDDEGFLEQLATMAGDVDQQKLEGTRALQRKAAEKCHEVPPICQLLVEKRMISEAQMLAMLKFQSRSGGGCLRSARDAIAARSKAKAGAGAALPTISLKDPRVRYGGVVAAFLVLALVIWAIAARASAEYMYVKCHDCNSVSRVRASDTFPVECPVCLHEAAYLAVKCPNDHIFGRNGVADRKACPVCGVSTAHELTEEEFLAIP